MFCYQEEEDEEIKSLVFDRMNHLDSITEDKEKVLKANHVFFKLLVSQFQKHSKFLENVNRSTGLNAVTSNNINTIIFGTFMKQPDNWRKELATDVFFKSKNVHLRHVLDKHCFFAYILRNEFYAILKQWLQEAYWIRAGNMMRSTISEPETFEGALLYCFREWTFEQKMMDLIARREKDVVKNDFAKLGLFEARENKFICRKLNRFFTTQTFHENFSTLKTDQVTKYVIENNLMDLLAEKFIDYRYIKALLDNIEVIYMKDELKLIEKMHSLMSPETETDEFLEIMNATSDYIAEFNNNFDRNSPELKFIDAALKGLPARDFEQISEVNQFTKTLMMKINFKDETLPKIEDLLENYHSINLDYIRDEFEHDENGEYNVNFYDKNLSNTHGDVMKLSYVDYVRQNQSAFGTYLLIKDILKNFMTISRAQILIGCEEVAKLAVESPENPELVSHVVSFLEILSVDSRNLRSFLRLLKLKPNDNSKDFETHLNEIIKLESNEKDLTDVEALETYWTVKKIEEPRRIYLNPFIAANDWFRLVLFAQYFNYPLQSFISICDKRIQNKPLRDNLIRAVLFDSSPELKKRCSFSKRRRVRSQRSEVS